MSRILAIFIVALLFVSPAFAQQDIAALEARARALYDQKAWVNPAGDNVVDVCKEIIRLDPTNATAAELLTKVTDIYVSAGERRLRNGEISRAVANFNQALSLDSSNQRARRGLESAKNAQSSQSFSVEPGKSPEYYLAKGNEFFGRKDYGRARKYYLAILETLPDDPFAKTRAQQCAEKLGLAAPTPGSGQESGENRTDYYREVAQQLEKAGEWDAAASYYKQIVAAEPDDLEARAGLQRAEDHAMGAGRIYFTMTGDPFWWSDNVKSAQEAKEKLSITVRILVDSTESASHTDSIIEILNLSEASRNDFQLPEGFSARVPKPGGENRVAVMIEAGGKKPKVFGAQAAFPVSPEEPLQIAIDGSSTLEYGGTLGLFKRMTGDYTIALKPLEDAEPAAE